MYIELKDALGLLTFHVRTTDINYVIEENKKICVNGNLISLNEESFQKVLDFMIHTNKMYYNTFN